MAQDDSADILTNEDVKLLFKSFPDLKKKFSENVSTKDIMDFMSEQAKECGIERGAHRLLEGLATVSAMKMHARWALEVKSTLQGLTELNIPKEQRNEYILQGLKELTGEDISKALTEKQKEDFIIEREKYLTGKILPARAEKEPDDAYSQRKDAYIQNGMKGLEELKNLNKKYGAFLAGLTPENKCELLGKLLRYKQSETPTLAVNKAECETIRDMSFMDAVSLLKVHNEVSNVFHKMPPKERGKFLCDENFLKFANLAMIAGNETGEKQSLNRGYFTKKTYGQRLVNGSIGDKNEVFKSFSAMSRVTGYLQNKAAIELGRGCQTNRDELKKDINFFCLHATETITLLSSSENNKKSPEELKKAISLHVEAISSKEKEVKAIINTDGVCRKALDSYFETNERTGMCPQLVPPQQETPKDYSNGNGMIYNNAHNYNNFVRG